MTGFPEVISLNVGGRHFDTTLSTLLKYEDSMLAAMFSGRHRVVTDKDDRYFIDRDGSHFGHILEFLRQDKLPPPDVAKAVLEDAEFYGLHQLSEKMETTYDGRYFVDRDGSHFGHILEFLRQDKLPPPDVAKAVHEDAEFYGLHLLCWQHFIVHLKHYRSLFSKHQNRYNH
ncbi:BTB/POZ domain-containing protein KCTD7-like [Branchiostoma floridae x Branchiostoma japonicum]